MYIHMFYTCIQFSQWKTSSMAMRGVGSLDPADLSERLASLPMAEGGGEEEGEGVQGDADQHLFSTEGKNV